MIEVLINENMVFGDLYTNKDALWSLLLFSGYLKADSIKETRVEDKYIELFKAEVKKCDYCFIIAPSSYFVYLVHQLACNGLLHSLIPLPIESSLYST